MKYSIFSLIHQAFRQQQDWKPAWREPEPKREYDIIIIGGGGHGLATAYYLAKEHGLRNIAVVEKGYIGGGSVGRNTTIVRSNYQEPGNIPFYEWSLKLWAMPDFMVKNELHSASLWTNFKAGDGK